MTNPTPIADSEGQADDQPAGAPQPEHINNPGGERDAAKRDDVNDDHKVAENAPED